jgi:FixJ family two-component response regulator
MEATRNKVFIVDDDNCVLNAISMLTSRILKKLAPELEVQSFSDSKKAIGALKSEVGKCVALVITDLRMPNATGNDVAHAAFECDAKVIMHTGNPDEVDSNVSTNPSYVLCAKPSGIDTIKAAIKQALDITSRDA